MPTRTEKGGILLELTVTFLLLAVFTAGAARVHAAYRHRFQRILDGRNAAIRELRGP